MERMRVRERLRERVRVTVRERDTDSHGDRDASVQLPYGSMQQPYTVVSAPVYRARTCSSETAVTAEA